MHRRWLRKAQECTIFCSSDTGDYCRNDHGGWAEDGVLLRFLEGKYCQRHAAGVVAGLFGNSAQLVAYAAGIPIGFAVVRGHLGGYLQQPSDGG